MSRLTALHINIIGIVSAIILSVALFFLLIKPKNEELETTKAATKSAEEAGGTQIAVNQKKSDLKKETAKAEETKRDWSRDSNYYMPKLNIAASNNPQDPRTLDVYQFNAYRNDRGELKGLKDIPTEWGRWVARWYDAQSRDGITRALPVFQIPAYAVDPNAVTGLTSLTFPESGKTWDVTVIAKDFDSAMRHLKQFNRMQGHGMPVIDKVAIEGQSPALALTYNLGMYIIPGSAPTPADSRIGGGGGGGAAAPGPGGFGGSYGAGYGQGAGAAGRGGKAGGAGAD